MFLACFSVKQKGSSSNVPFKNSYGTVMVAVVEKPGLSSTVGRCNRNFTHISSEEFVSKMARPKIHCWLVVWKCLEHFFVVRFSWEFHDPN